jgi:hypothetical protein
VQVRLAVDGPEEAESNVHVSRLVASVPRRLGGHYQEHSADAEGLPQGDPVAHRVPERTDKGCVSGSKNKQKLFGE